MDSLIAALITLGPGGLIAAIILVLGVPAFAAVWKLWRTSESARDAEGKVAADALFEQRIVNVQATGTIERLQEKIADVQRRLDRCEGNLDRVRFPEGGRPHPEVSG